MTPARLARWMAAGKAAYRAALAEQQPAAAARLLSSQPRGGNADRPATAKETSTMYEVHLYFFSNAEKTSVHSWPKTSGPFARAAAGASPRGERPFPV